MRAHQARCRAVTGASPFLTGPFADLGAPRVRSIADALEAVGRTSAVRVDGVSRACIWLDFWTDSARSWRVSQKIELTCDFDVRHTCRSALEGAVPVVTDLVAPAPSSSPAARTSCRAVRPLARCTGEHSCGEGGTNDTDQPKRLCGARPSTTAAASHSAAAARSSTGRKARRQYPWKLSATPDPRPRRPLSAASAAGVIR